MVNHGVVSLLIHASENSSRTRVSIAASSPRRRARACWFAGSLPDRIEMKMTLSTPRTISRKVSVARAIQTWGSENDSIMASQPLCLSSAPLHRLEIQPQFGEPVHFIVVETDLPPTTGDLHFV